MKIFIIIIASLLLTYGCSRKIGKYVYMDKREILHISNKCEEIYQGVTRYEIESDENIWNYELKDRYGREIGRKSKRMICEECVGDEEYETLCDKRNKYIKMRFDNIEKERRKLYKKLIDDGYQLGSFDDFVSNMNSTYSRDKLYYNLCEDGYQLGSHDDFCEKFGELCIYK